MKDIKKLLRGQSKDILPDKKIKEEIRAQVYGAQTDYVNGNTKVKAHKKSLLPLIAGALALAIILCIILPVMLSGGNGSLTDSGTLSTAEAENFYAYGAASAGSVLSGKTDNSMTSATGNVTYSLNTVYATTVTTEEQQATKLIGEYIYFVEELLGGGSVTHTTTTADQSYSADYAFYMVITYSDLLGDNVNYTMYYNEIKTSESTDGDEQETNYSISGILVVGGATYTVTGGRSTETETGEQESEYWYKVQTGDNSYILIKQEYEEEVEDGETETEKTTEISVYTDGVLTEKVVAEMEADADETELVLQITSGGTQYSYCFTLNEENGDPVLEVEYKSGGTVTRFKIYIENGVYRYVFDDGEIEESRYK